MDNRLFLEIIAERKIAEHLKKCVVPRGIADIVEVIMLAARAHAFLAGYRPAIGPRFEAREDILERHHARINEHERGIILRHKRRRRHAFMPGLAEIIDEGSADVVGRSHDAALRRAGLE